MGFGEIGFQKMVILVATCTLLCAVFSVARGQQTGVNVPAMNVAPSGKAPGESVSRNTNPSDPGTSREAKELKVDGLSDRERLLLERVDQLERRLAEVESRLPGKVETGNGGFRWVGRRGSTSPWRPLNAPAAVPAQIDPADREVLDFFRDTTFNVTLDGYYGYNFNRPSAASTCCARTMSLATVSVSIRRL